MNKIQTEKPETQRWQSYTLAKYVALRNGGWPRAFNYFGFVVAAAGLITVVPALGETGGMIFGLTQIIWFAWLGIALLRNRPAMATEKTDAYATRQGVSV